MRNCVLLLALGLVLAGCGVAVDEPKYTSVMRDGRFEVRDYPALTVAEVTVPGGQWRAANRGFGLLAGYIFGGNAPRAGGAAADGGQAGEKIAMTAPVTQTAAADGWVVRFFMPAGATPESLPVPADGRVRLAVLPAERVAVVRFSGLALPGGVAARTAALRGWMAKRGLVAKGAATLAQYDPPWTLWFLRRNEVMVPVGE